MRARTQSEGARIVFDYFNKEIAGSIDRVAELVSMSKRQKNPDLKLEYLLRAGGERKRTAKWAYWLALQMPDAAYRSAACVKAIKLLEDAYPHKSNIGFRIAHPLIAGKLSMLGDTLDDCIRELKRPDAQG